MKNELKDYKIDCTNRHPMEAIMAAEAMGYDARNTEIIHNTYNDGGWDFFYLSLRGGTIMYGISKTIYLKSQKREISYDNFLKLADDFLSNNGHPKAGDIVLVSHLNTPNSETFQKEFVVKVGDAYYCKKSDGSDDLEAFYGFIEVVQKEDLGEKCGPRKPYFVNSLGEEFFMGDVMWWYCKDGFGGVFSYPLSHSSSPDEGEDTSEAYKSEDTAKEMLHRWTIITAVEAGKMIEGRGIDGGKWGHWPGTDPYNELAWGHYEYRIKPEPKYRPYNMDEAEEFLGVKCRTSGGVKVRILGGTPVSQEALNIMFKRWETFDGKPVGKLIEEQQ